MKQQFYPLFKKKQKGRTTFTGNEAKLTQIQKTYYHFVLYNYVERDFLYAFSGGKWNRQTNQNVSSSTGKMMINEPVITLILSN